jgi:hypothetical protein
LREGGYDPGFFRRFASKMKKFILLIAILAGAGWWYFVGGRRISEDHVTRFYQELEAATLNRNPEALCALLADDFETSGTVEIGGKTGSSTRNKTQTCRAYAATYENFEKLGDKMGGVLQLDSSYNINSIEIQPDRKSALVDFSSSLDVGETIMNIHSHSTDTLIRRNGKTLMLRSEGTGSIRSGG